MAQLNAAQKAKLWAKGLFVREKCDRSECPKVILELSYAGQSGRVYCSRKCRDDNADVLPKGGLKPVRKKHRQLVKKMFRIVSVEDVPVAEE